MSNSAPPSATMSAQDLRIYIESQDDFAFEREVYHRSAALGLDAHHAGLYEDPVTNKPRQFDVRASKVIDNLKICLTIECKGLVPTFPLLVSCVPRARSESFHELLYVSDVVGSNASFTRVQRYPGEQSFYRQGQPVGKNLRQVRRDSGKLVSGDEVFDKWMQALASASEMVAESANLLRARRADGPKFVAVIPVLVVSDETLWVADYGSNGQLKGDPLQVSDITFFVGRKYALVREILTFTISHLHIETRSHINTLLEQVAKRGGTWEELFGATVM